MKYVYALSIFLISGCSSPSFFTHIPSTPENFNKHVALFLDGTGNDFDSGTNISRLYDITVNQPRNDIVAYYGEGIGTKRNKILRMMIGWGIGKDVRDAYKFLVENFNPATDTLYLFGFSRGAYTARILAGFLFYTGLVVAEEQTGSELFRKWP